jgi:hypothetical protein
VAVAGDLLRETAAVTPARPLQTAAPLSGLPATHFRKKSSIAEAGLAKFLLHDCFNF